MNLDPMQNITERRRQTRNRMYKFIYDAKTPVSKQQIAATMGFSLPTVHQNLSELLDGGFIRPAEVMRSTGGRPAIGYTIDEKMRYSVGVAVSSGHIRILLTDLYQNEIDFRVRRTTNKDGEVIAEYIQEDLEKCLKENAVPIEKLLGVGITFPGVVDRNKDCIVLSPTMGIKDIAFSTILKNLPYRVYIENDSTSGGTAEWLGLSPEEKKQDFVYLFLENGIGGAVFIDGKPYAGVHSRSGEFGHMKIVPNGIKCNCGQRGCLEAYCTANRFTRDLGIQTDEFFKELENGNREYQKIWKDVLKYLAIATNNLRMTFDCKIILGGFVTEYMKPYLDELRRLSAELSPFETDGSDICLGKYPRRAGMMGVAWHFSEEFIENI